MMKIIRVLTLAALGLCVVPTWAQPGGRPGGPPMGGMRGMMRSPKMRLPRLVEGATRLGGSNALSKSQARQMVKLIAPWKNRPTMSEDAGKALFSGLTNTLTASQKTAMQNDRPGPPGGGRGPGGPDGRMGGPGGGPDGGRGQGQGREGRPGGGMGGPGGRMGAPGGRMGGPGGGMGQAPTKAQMDKMRSMMASYNPLYMGSSAALASLPDPMKRGMERRRDRLKAAMSQLQQKAR